ncbi:hypothetical protein [Silvimonas amylolytica]|uniref:Uncharacterized protein n=1 Tax=Silvimonas amylolytica TaxID=449663 RepID=A0ABQ2PKK5_9NEIS|nr:hypothetical protein [Silvimonas amylolytica]GGP25861.1 hypothetical protein GCM10010971_16800 [Silvimonas amylolytica]
MKYLLILITLALPSAFVCAKGKPVLGPVVHEVRFDACHYRVTDTFNGWIDLNTEGSTHTFSYIANLNPKAKRPFETSIQFYCDSNKGMDKAFFDMGMQRTTGKWALKDGDDKPLAEEHAVFYTLQSTGWNGGGYGLDQTWGEPKDRTRSFAFCLTNGPQTLCGYSEVVGYAKRPHEWVIPQVIKLLQSIEFIDVPVTDKASATAAAP